MSIGMALVRKGLLDVEDIREASKRAAAQDSPHALTVAHLLSCILIQAEAPSQSDWEAAQRRKQIRVVPTDGGNEP